MTKQIKIYTLENEELLIQIMNLGATLISFIDKQTNTNLVLGFDRAADYKIHHTTFMGATVGRCANRIQDGRFILNQTEYRLARNKGPNSLHGGIDNFSFKYFDAEKDHQSIIFRYTSKDMEEGYPGNLQVEIMYQLDHNHLIYTMKGFSDQDTLFNLTNHSYFNLNGKGNILSHRMKIYTNQAALVDQNGLTTDQSFCVNDTAFDFLDFKVIHDQLKKGHPNLSLANGYDHNYLFEERNDHRRVELTNGELLLKIESDLPGMHVYSGNYLDCEGRNHEWYGSKSGICFECQFYPNAINYMGFKKPILKANQKIEHYIRYSVEKERNENKRYPGII